MEKLDRSIRARCPVIGIETPETRRFMEGLVQVIENDNRRNIRADNKRPRRKLFSFSVTQGLTQVATYSGELGSESIVYDEQSVMEPGPEPDFSVVMAIDIILEQGKENDEPVIYMLKDVDEYMENPLVVRALRDLAEILIRRRQTVILVSPDLGGLPEVLNKDIKVISWPLPTKDELNQQVESFVQNLTDAEVNLNGTRDELIEALRGLTVNEADQVLAEAVINHGVLDERAVNFTIDAKAEIIRSSGALEFYPPSVKMGDVGGLDNLKDWLVKAGRSLTPQARQFGIQPARGALVVGVPGCGKSLTAKLLASLWGVPLLRLDVGALFGSLVGSSEAQTRQALKLAGAIGRCVLWIDEIEKGLSSQGGELDGGTSKRVLGTILTWMEEQSGASGVFVFATANDIESLRPELVRRFTEVFFVDIPTPQERETIFNIHLRKSGRDPQQFDVSKPVELSQTFTGAEIEEAVQGALWIAFSEDRDLTNQDLIDAVNETVPLLTTMGEQVERMRKWAARARPASRYQQSGRQTQRTQGGTGSRAQALEM
jgi:MoxR-like ATPase